LSSFLRHPVCTGLTIAALSLSAVVTGTGILIAQDQPLLARVQVIGGAANTCPALFISFESELNYLSTEYSADHRTVSFRLTRPVGGTTADPGADLIETYPRVDVPGMGQVDISLEANTPTPLLTVRFVTAIKLQVAQAGDRSIVISDISLVGAASCDAPPPAADMAATDGEQPKTDADVSETEKNFLKARRAITQGDYGRAIQLLTTLAGAPAHSRSEDSQELLGIARERNQQFAHARAEYETYLAQYPESDGAARVQQRLAAIITAQEQAPAPLAGDNVGKTVLADLPQDPLPPIRPVRRTRPVIQTEEEKEPAIRGLVSSYYFRNQGSTVFTEFATNSSDSEDEVYENALVTSLDIEGTHDTDTHTFSWRIAGDHDLSFGPPEEHSVSLSRAYLNIDPKQSGLSYRIGRQSRSDGGILGRFDGGQATLEMNKGVTLTAVLGSPVDSSSDGVFESEKLLFGLSASYEDIVPNLDGTVYFASQFREGYTDRQAIGLEGQYQTNSVSISGLLDYDTYFNQIGLARISGTWIAPDQSSFTASADYLKSPLLSFSNALTGQTTTTLKALGGIYSAAQLKQLALDRTAETASLTLAYSRPISGIWQFSADGSVFYTGGTPASGGVPAQPASGTEFYGSVQFVGNNVFANRDTISVALRFADTATSDLILLDAYDRFQFKTGLRLKPRLRVGYRELASGGQELFAVSTLNATYKLNDQTDFEIEIGSRVSNLSTPSFAEESNELFLTLGVNRQF